MRLCVAAGVVWMAIAAVAMADDMRASISKPTNIPAQELGPALRILAKDRNLQITYASEGIGERRTQGAVSTLYSASPGCMTNWKRLEVHWKVNGWRRPTALWPAMRVVLP